VAAANQPSASVSSAGTGWRISSAQFRAALTLNPRGGGEEANLGRVLLARNQFDEAIPHLEKALEYGPETAKLHNNLGMALAERASRI
jgi:Flp pilus assembly protein TadD